MGVNIVFLLSLKTVVMPPWKCVQFFFKMYTLAFIDIWFYRAGFIGAAGSINMQICCVCYYIRLRVLLYKVALLH